MNKNYLIKLYFNNIKNIFYIIIINFLIFFIMLNKAYALSEEEKLMQAQNIIKQGNTGESIFQGKQDRDSTIKDFANSSIKIDPINKEVNSYQNAQYQNY